MALCTLKSSASSRRSKRLPQAQVSANWHVCANVAAAAGGGSGKALRVRLPSGEVVRAELHWYEATGIGKREFKIKQFL